MMFAGGSHLGIVGAVGQERVWMAQGTPPPLKPLAPTAARAVVPKQ
jgi:hypothetical protein